MVKVKYNLICMFIFINMIAYAENVVNVQYYDAPVTINASKNALNLIKLPYQILSVQSSKDGFKYGQGDKEFTVTIPGNTDSDFAIITDNKTFMVNLHPSLEGSAVINISDRNPDNDNVDIISTNPMYETVSELIKAMYTHDQLRGYYVSNVRNTYKVDKVGNFTNTHLYEGVRYVGKVYTFFNNTAETVKLNVESKDFINLIKKLNEEKPVAAISVAEEIVNPKDVSEIFVIIVVK